MTLHMDVKGDGSEVVKLLLDADAAIVLLPNKLGFTTLRVAFRKRRPEMVNELLSLPDTSAHVNALTRDHKTALDVVEGPPLSEESSEINDCLVRNGAVRANELNQPRDKLRNTVTQIKNDYTVSKNAHQMSVSKLGYRVHLLLQVLTNET